MTPVDPHADGLFWEGRVADALGVRRKLLARLRQDHLSEGVDFVRREANAVVLTATGLEKIERLVKEGGGGVENERETTGKPSSSGKSDAGVPAGPAPREKMRVERVPSHPQLLLCLSEVTRKLVVVRVRENSHFVPGMRIEAIASTHGVWQFHNRELGGPTTIGRLPRQKGRW